MKLYFEVISKDRLYLGDAASYTFTHSGGCIGRAGSSSWVLEDVNSFISSTHLHISCHSNGFYVTDVSTNGTFRGHQRLKVGVEDPMPLRRGDELLLGDVKIRVISVETAESREDISEISLPTLVNRPNSKAHYGSLDELQVLAQQARLADVISQCYPEIDHGQEHLLADKKRHVHAANLDNMNKDEQNQTQHSTELSQETPREAQSFEHITNTERVISHSIDQSMNMTGTDEGLKKEESLSVDDLLETVIKVLFVEIQQQLAVDRIENPPYYLTMSENNIFRHAVSLVEFCSLVQSHASVRQDVQEVLHYLVDKPCNEL